jgi:hypothetical protein
MTLFHIPFFEVLASPHGAPRASAWHDLVLLVLCFECGILVLSLPYPCEYMFEHGCRYLCAARSRARRVTSARLKSHSALTSKKRHSIGGNLRRQEILEVGYHFPSSIKRPRCGKSSKGALNIFEFMLLNTCRRRDEAHDLGDVTGFSLRSCALIVEAGAAEMSW